MAKIKLLVNIVIGIILISIWQSASFAGVSKELESVSEQSANHFSSPVNDYIGDLYACGDFVYYETQNDGVYKDWRTDGTTVEEVDTSSESHKSYRTWCANELHVRLNRGQLWRTDGPTEARYVIKDISGWELQIWRNEFYFVSPNDDESNSLWKSDGTTEGTVQLATFAGTISTNGRILDSTGDESAFYFMVVSGAASSAQIWQTDGTPEGTVIVDMGEFYIDSETDIHATDSDVFVANQASIAKMDDSSATVNWSYGFGDMHAWYMTNVSDTIFIAANDGEHGQEMWRTDGTTSGTFMLQDIYPGAVGSDPHALTPVGNELYFVVRSASDPETIMDLWKSDGSVAGTVLVKQFTSPFGIEDFGLANMGDELVFWSAVSGYRALWLTGGTVSGVQKIMDFNGIDTDNMLVHNDVFYFIGGKSLETGIQLWKRDCRSVGAVNVGAAAAHFPSVDAEISIYLPLLHTPPFVDDCITEAISN